MSEKEAIEVEEANVKLVRGFEGPQLFVNHTGKDISEDSYEAIKELLTDD